MNIEFYPSSKAVELLVPSPKPAAHYVPSWYKGLPKVSEKNMSVTKLDSMGLGLKACVPFLDAMLSGYIQETWQDIIVDHNSETGEVGIRFGAGPDIVASRDIIHTPLGPDFYNVEFVWKLPWIPKLPNGWSALYTSPLNHTELPFVSLSGIIDSDKFYHVPFGNYPFYIKRGFSGIIPAGTPMFQITPILRKDWTSSSAKWNEEEQNKREFSLRKYAFEAYKKIFYVKKSFS
jgi:hypothetical protein